MIKLNSLFIILIFISFSCSDNEKRSDAYGNFEAIETIVSAEATGKLIEFNVEEGQFVEENATVGKIDTEQLLLKVQQLQSQKKTISTKFKNVYSQIAVLQEQRKINLKEKSRIENLIKDDAATTKQLDDINGIIRVIDRQIASIESQNSTTMQELKSIDVQIEQINDQINKCNVINPVKGTILMKFAEKSEVVAYGKPLYKIADLSIMELRLYISGDQLPEIKLNQNVKVLIDRGKKEYSEYEGEISWISSKAEFTPKIIQTKEDRVNLVYAVKVKVKNDGTLKIGMPGEVVFK